MPLRLPNASLALATYHAIDLLPFRANYAFRKLSLVGTEGAVILANCRRFATAFVMFTVLVLARPGLGRIP
jgi:hypothetical protein